MRIVFISSLSLATNPRFVKEIRLALEKGYSTQVICFEFDNWSKNFDKQIRESLVGAELKIIPAGRKPFFQWLQSVLMEKYYRKFHRTDISNIRTLGIAASRRTALLLNAVEKIKGADLVIGHNPGAIAATLQLAERCNCACGFDVEDYHPGETADPVLKAITKKLLQLSLPKMSYVSFASPLIQQAIKNDLKETTAYCKKTIDILNFFPAADFNPPATKNGVPKLVWYSQHIAPGRGLEKLLPALANNGTDLELHLFGQPDHQFFESWLKGKKYIHVHQPLPQQQLLQRLADFDIGLAVEINIDGNRDICLTNKFLSYLQAGLFVLASDTSAQRQFLNSHPSCGHLVHLEKGITGADIDGILSRIESIRKLQQQRFDSFQNINWERERIKLHEVWMLSA